MGVGSWPDVCRTELMRIMAVPLPKTAGAPLTGVEELTLRAMRLNTNVAGGSQAFKLLVSAAAKAAAASQRAQLESALRVFKANANGRSKQLLRRCLSTRVQRMLSAAELRRMGRMDAAEDEGQEDEDEDEDEDEAPRSRRRGAGKKRGAGGGGGKARQQPEKRQRRGSGPPGREMQAVEKVLTRLCTEEVCALFANPVDLKLFKDYRQYVAEPMDLRTMLGKLRAGEYQDVNEMKPDFALITSNCVAYNDDGADIAEAVRKVRETVLGTRTNPVP